MQKKYLTDMFKKIITCRLKLKINSQNFILNRKTLLMKHENNDSKSDFKCEILKEDFMYEMNNIKSKYQSQLDNKLKSNGI